MLDTEGPATEEWRPVVGFEGIYEVSSEGRVRRSPNAPRRNSTKPGRILNATISQSARYYRVTLHHRDKVARKCVHRLVAEAFLGPAPPFRQVNHIDGDRANNRAANLEYVTAKGNVAHAWRTGLCKPSRGTDHGCARLTEHDVFVIRDAYDRSVPLEHIANTFGISTGSVSGIGRRVHWKHLPENTHAAQLQ